LRSAQVLAVRALLLGTLLATAGCFRPLISTAGYSCGDAGVDLPGICPANFVCNRSSHLCVSSLDGGVGTGGTTGTGGKSGTGGTTGTGGTGGVDAGPCTEPVAGCSSIDAGMCDPVCNTGCGCHDKCSVNTSGGLTCNEPYQTNVTAGGLLQLCSQYAVAGDPDTQSDNCAPGQVCIGANTCGNRCYQFCRTNSDCTNDAGCSRDAGGGYTVCDVPPVACDPVIGAASTVASGCPGMTALSLFGCYLSATTTTTLCDCRNNTDNAGEGSPCSHSRDCFAGLICIARSPSDSKVCRRVCRLSGDAGAQSNEGTCASGPQACTPIAFPDGTTNPTYGFCND
jgi:hypothetical protein